MKLLFENKYIRIYLNGSHKCLEYHWKSYPSTKQFKALMEKIYKYINQYKCNKLLPDLRNMYTLNEEMRLWAESEWFPRLVRIGVKTYAIVKRSSEWSSDCPDRFYATPEKPKCVFGITTVYFDDVQKARSWIASLPNTRSHN